MADPIVFTLGTSERRAVRIFENGARKTDLSGITRWTATLAGVTVDSDDNPECFDWTSYQDLDGTSDVLSLEFGTLDLDLGPTSLALIYFNSTHPSGKQLDFSIPALVQGVASGLPPATLGTVSSSDVALSGVPGKVLTDLFDGGYDVTVKPALVDTLDLITKGPWVDVRAYGAVSGADCTTAIQAAVTAGGTNLIFPSGTWILSQVTGVSGAWTLHPGATIQHKAAASGNMIATSGDFKILGGTIDGNRANQTGRYYTIYDAGYSFLARDVVFTGTVSGGVWGYGIANKTFRVLDCTFHDMAEHGGSAGQTSLGIYVSGVSAGADIQIRGNEFRGNNPVDDASAPGGLEIFSTYGNMASASITDNHFYLIGQNKAGNSISAVDVYGQVDNLVVRGNRFEYSTFIPIKIKNCDSAVITANTIGAPHWNSSSYAILVSAYDTALGAPGRDSLHQVISQNVITGWTAGGGIWVAGEVGHLAEHVIVSDNVITGFATHGIGMHYAQNAQMRGNLISGGTGATATDGGIYLEYCGDGIVVDGGRIGENASYGVVANVASAGTSLMIRNVDFGANTNQDIYANGVAAIYIQGNRFTGACAPVAFAGTVALAEITGNRSAYAQGSLAATSLLRRDNIWNGKFDTRRWAQASVTDAGAFNHGLSAAPAWVLATGTVFGEIVTFNSASSTQIVLDIKKRADGAAGTSQTVYSEAGVQ